VTAVPVTRTFVAGEVVTAAYFNTNINGPLLFLLSPPILEVRQTANQNLTNNTTTALTFTSEDVDSSGMHSTVSNTSRATAVYPGWYLFSGKYSPAANVTGSRFVWWLVNSTDVNGSQGDGAGTVGTTFMVNTKKLFLNVGDIAELAALQSSGGTLGTNTGTRAQSAMSCQWVSN
jgi:hypothetical protein